MCEIWDLLFLSNHGIPFTLKWNRPHPELSKYKQRNSWFRTHAVTYHYKDTLSQKQWIEQGDATGFTGEQSGSWDGHEFITGRGVEISEAFWTFTLHGSLVHKLGFLWKGFYWRGNICLLKASRIHILTTSSTLLLPDWVTLKITFPFEIARFAKETCAFFDHPQMVSWMLGNCCWLLNQI